MKRYKPLFEKIYIELEEDLQLSDLANNAGMSNFTAPFRKETSKLLGKSTSTVKLVDAKLNIKKDWITYYFLTERTPKYSKDSPMKVSDEKDFHLKKDNTYTIEVRILDILKWINTYDIKDKINRKDLKDILKVASIQWWSNVPSFHWQGSNYILSTFDASIYPTDIPPEHWKNYHNNDNFLDKHSQGIANTLLSFWLNPMSSMLEKRLKDVGVL